MENELQVLTEISHPNIVKVFELLHDDSNYYMISELIKHGELFDFVYERNDSEEGPL